MLGVRTADTSTAPKLKKNLGVGSTYYVQQEGADQPTRYDLQTEDGIDNKFENNAFIVTYTESEEDAVSGEIRYVCYDEEHPEGYVVETTQVDGIGGDGKEVHIQESFMKDDCYWRTISALGGKKVKLSSTNASYTVTVVMVDDINDSKPYSVVINYVDEKGNKLWSDKVDVRGHGYRYTVPNVFSIDSSQSYSTGDAVNLYQLKAVIGGQPVDGEEAIETETIESQSETPSNDEGTTVKPSVYPGPAVIPASTTANGTAVNFTKYMTDADFNGKEGNSRVVTAVYESQAVTEELEFKLVAINGETGDELGTVTAKITPQGVKIDSSNELLAQQATAKKDKGGAEYFAYNPTNFKLDNTTYVPWAGNTSEITCSWGTSTELLQYVYYVPEGYVPGPAYGVTVQYMNIATGQVIRTEIEMIDPEITNFVEITGPQTFTQDGNEYVRLAGQDTAIRHAFLSPNRVYTIYYRNVNDTINANTVIDRVQIIQTTQPGTGGGLTAAPVAVDGDPGVDAGVGAGDGTVIINDDDNPLANLDGQDTTTERTIAENENPLYSGGGLNGFAIAGAAIGAIVLIGLVAYFLLRRRKQANDKQNA